MEKSNENEQKVTKSTNSLVNISDVLINIKNNSWVGYLANDTSEIEYIRTELKALLKGDEVIGVDRVKVLKQLQDIDNEIAKRAMHLDNMMIKSSAIHKLSPEGQKEVKDLW